jgi:NAD(P)-dependent dehydrogenase (short-subunit alcohol dehydrogenase family)
VHDGGDGARTVLITGSVAWALGRTLTVELVRHGHAVVGCVRSTEQAPPLSRGRYHVVVRHAGDHGITSNSRDDGPGEPVNQAANPLETLLLPKRPRAILFQSSGWQLSVASVKKTKKRIFFCMRACRTV